MTMQGKITKLERTDYFDADGIRMHRYWFTVADRQMKLEVREEAPLELSEGDEVVLEPAPDGVLVLSIYNMFRDRGHGPRWKALKKGLGKWASARVIAGEVKHKERNRTRDDLSRDGYHTLVYYVIELTNGDRFLVDERAGKSVRPGHAVEALLVRGGRDEFDTQAFRNLSAGTDSMPSPWPMRFSFVATMGMAVTCILIARDHEMDGPRWAMLALFMAVPGVLLYMFSFRWRMARASLEQLSRSRVSHDRSALVT
ncbi:MAG: hypothetical protein WAT74_11885 [Flavobacteriales bacterium]